VNKSNNSVAHLRGRSVGPTSLSERGVGHFRRACTAAHRSQPLLAQRTQKNARTCFEGPFGEVVCKTGVMATANPVRFSTKYQDDETDLLYYRYRYYNASPGRWLSRDPKAELGGKNIYTFLKNLPIDRVDVLGLGEFVMTETALHDGHQPNVGGFTVWDRFAPEAQVFSSDGCCFHVRLNGGTARPWILYNEGTLFEENILEHELYHVGHHLRPAYNDYKVAAAALGAPCMNKGRAMCVKAVLESELAGEYEARTYRDGAAYDYLAYGWRDPSLQDAWSRMLRTEAEYEQAHNATAAALAACNSND
jgi:RHS repeat-associated protein